MTKIKIDEELIDGVYSIWDRFRQKIKGNVKALKEVEAIGGEINRIAGYLTLAYCLKAEIEIDTKAELKDYYDEITKKVREELEKEEDK